MESYLVAAASAVWLGILTSISPCPLATNIAAISYIGNRIDNPMMVFLSGLLYMLGRILVYLVLGIFLVTSLLSIPDVSFFLQENMNKILGPILILVGIFLLGFVTFNLSGVGISEKIQKRLAGYGVWGAGVLGMLFALAFCPISAALFFGSLIPLSIKHNSNFLMPLLYGAGTALPVILFALLVSLSTRLVSIFFNKITQFELWARRITGIVFILVGLYLTLVYIFNIPL
jgi:cytochrome c biogenesis protein CcdA